MITRRNALLGLFCAPAIVRASSLMAIKPLPTFDCIKVSDWLYVMRVLPYDVLRNTGYIFSGGHDGSAAGA